MNNKIIKFLSERAECDHWISIHNGKKKTYADLIEKFPPKHKYHRYLDSICRHVYGAIYPDNLDVSVFVDYDDNDYKERAREIALESAKENAQYACMQKWRETQGNKKQKE